MGKNPETAVTVPSWNFRTLAWVPEGLLQPGSAELAAQLLVSRGSCARPPLLGVLRLRGRTWPLRRDVEAGGESVGIWTWKVPDALRPVSLLGPFAHCRLSYTSQALVPAS